MRDVNCILIINEHFASRWRIYVIITRYTRVHVVSREGVHSAANCSRTPSDCREVKGLQRLG